MYFVLGLLTAGLLALTVTPAIWRRAARLTKARVESSVPMSLAEIQADKDHLRAQHAVATRRLEMALGKLETRSAEQSVEVDRRREEVLRLNREKAALSATIAGLETRVGTLDEELRGTASRLDQAQAELVQRDAQLAERARILAELEKARAALQELSDEQKLELVARSTEVGNLSDSLLAARDAELATALARDELSGLLSLEKAQSAAERGRVEALGARMGTLEAERLDRLAVLEKQAAEISATTTELATERNRRDLLAAEVTRLEAERAERLDELRRRLDELDRLKRELSDAAAARSVIEEKLVAAEIALAEARAEISTLRMKAEIGQMSEGDNIRKAIAATEAEKAALETRLSKLEAEQAALLSENAELRKVVGAEWESERAENANLRRRLGEIAANVMKLTEAPGAAPPAGLHLVEDANGNGEAAPRTTPPQPLQRPRPPVEAERAAAVEGTRPAETRSLAERLRALQHTAARH